MNTKYDIDETVMCYAYDRKSMEKCIQKCVVSMITITRKGIRYRVKVGYDNQEEVWEDDIIGGAE